MKIEISKEDRAQAIASIQQYFQENMDGPIGELAAGLLLNFFVEDIGPVIYNRAIADAQQRMEQRIGDLNGELYFPEFQYWSREERNIGRSSVSRLARIRAVGWGQFVVHKAGLSQRVPVREAESIVLGSIPAP
jgi:uncharacterized protein (DUF2164 family)